MKVYTDIYGQINAVMGIYLSICVAKVKLTNIVGQAKQDEDISKTGLVLVNDLVLLMIRNV